MFLLFIPVFAASAAADEPSVHLAAARRRAVVGAPRSSSRPAPDRRRDTTRAPGRRIGHRSLGKLAAALLAILGATAPIGRAAALPPDEASPPAQQAWTLRTRAVMSGSSTHSDPAGYKIYSGIGVEAGVARQLSRAFALELTMRTESREIDVDSGTGTDTRLGSLELLPISLMVQYFPLAGTFRPYAGAGVNLTVCWEKSGALDGTQVSPSVGPVLQAGVDVALSSALFLNLDLRWNLLRTDVSAQGTKVATLEIDPLTLGVGLGVRL
ncbi:MAG TPA: OmpW family outer membrane protein [Anaeromyxobacteraceae bacterium]|nr:OmpW family outer membrane protein [Anaeromyxobacteraceae bacterium]